jgi:hypothetical protein
LRVARKLVVPPLAVALGAAALSTVGFLAVTSGAQADATTSLPQLTGFHQMVVDSADGYIFISQGPGIQSIQESGTQVATSGIVVADLSGNYVTTLDSGDGAEGLALDGGTLYAALAGQDAVAAIQASSITSTTTTPTQVLYPLGAGNIPYSLAVQGGKVWVSYQTAGVAPNGAIGDITPGTTASFEADPAVVPAPGSSWSEAPDLAADPQDTGVVVAATAALDPTSVATFSVSGGPSVLAGSAFFQACENEDAIAVLPGGGQFALACPASSGGGLYNTADLSAASSGTYPAATGTSAYAVSPDGAAATGTAAEPPIAQDSVIDMDAYAPGGVLRNQYSLDAYLTSLAANGLAWSADDSVLAAVTATDSSSSPTVAYSLRVLDNPLVTTSALTLGGPSTVLPGKSFSISGVISFNTGSITTGNPITVTRENPNGTTTTLPSLVTAPSGSFTITDKLSALGGYVYTAKYAGTSTTSPASRTFKVMVAKASPTLTLSTGAPTALYGSTVHVTTHLGSTDTNRTVSVYYQLVGTGTKRLLKTAKLSSSGILVLSYPDATRNVIFSVTFSGDAQYFPRSISVRLGVDVRVAMTNSGWYTTAKFNGGTYHVFHSNAHLNVAVSVTPDKHGEKLYLVGQQWYNNTWNDGDVFKLNLGKTSAISGYLTLAQVSGAYFRLRAVFVPGSTDVTNVSYYSGWFYFKVVR